MNLNERLIIVGYNYDHGSTPFFYCGTDIDGNHSFMPTYDEQQVQLFFSMSSARSVVDNFRNENKDEPNIHFETKKVKITPKINHSF